MLQVNIALGILYIALRESRYRDKLFDIVVAGFRSQNVSERAAAMLSQRLAKDNDFSMGYHRMAMWRGELSAHHLASVAKQPSANLFRSVTKPQTPPKVYRWYRSNNDKLACFFASVLLPIAMTWQVVLATEANSTCSSWHYAALALGQVCVGGHVLIGRLMVWWEGRQFTVTLRDFIVALEDEHARAEFAKSRPSWIVDPPPSRRS